MKVNSYDPDAPLPKLRSHWIWEIEQPHARALIEVVDVTWNGEEWWVRTRTLLGNGADPDGSDNMHLNDLSRFWEACLPVLPKITGRLDQFTSSRGPARAPNGPLEGGFSA